MPLACLVNQIPGQPIIVATLTGHFTIHEATSLYAEILEVAAEFDGPYYRILEVSGLSLDLDDIMYVIGETASGTPGSFSDPRVLKNFYVGLGERGQTLQVQLDQDPNRAFEIVIFNTLEQALNTIYAEMNGALDDPPDDET